MSEQSSENHYPPAPPIPNEWPPDLRSSSSICDYVVDMARYDQPADPESPIGSARIGGNPEDLAAYYEQDGHIVVLRVKTTAQIIPVTPTTEAAGFDGTKEYIWDYRLTATAHGVLVTVDADNVFRDFKVDTAMARMPGALKNGMLPNLRNRMLDAASQKQGAIWLVRTPVADGRGNAKRHWQFICHMSQSDIWGAEGSGPEEEAAIPVQRLLENKKVALVFQRLDEHIIYTAAGAKLVMEKLDAQDFRRAMGRLGARLTITVAGAIVGGIAHHGHFGAGWYDGVPDADFSSLDLGNGFTAAGMVSQANEVGDMIAQAHDPQFGAEIQGRFDTSLQTTSGHNVGSDAAGHLYDKTTGQSVSSTSTVNHPPKQ